MSNFNPIKKKIADLILKNELRNQKREAIVSNLSSAQKIGILFFAKDEKTYKTVKEFVKQLKEAGVKEVMAIGYVHEKELPNYLMAKLEFDYFTKKEVSWQLKPTSITAKRFTNTAYDILIDLTAESIFPLKYMLARSKAHFKVGRGIREKEEMFDMTLEIPDVKSLSYLISQLNHYLQIINQPNNEQ